MTDRRSQGRWRRVVISISPVFAVLVSLCAFVAEVGWLVGLALALGIVAMSAAMTRRWSWLALVLCLVVTVMSARHAHTERREMLEGTSCRLRSLDFDNDTIEQIDRQWWPPRVLCRYGYSYLNSSVDEWRDRWDLYDPFLFAAGTVAIGVVVVRQRRSVAGVGGAEAVALRPFVE